MLSGLRLAVLAVAAVSMFGGCDLGMPGQVNYQGTLTVLNRTTAELTVTSGPQIRFTVPACDEITREDFPINWWHVTSPGRDTFQSGGGDYGPHSYLVVTSFVKQQDQRPDPLPACEGLLQPAPH
jgi:hypothetical protein